MTEKPDSHSANNAVKQSGSEGAGNTASEPNHADLRRINAMADKALTPHAGDRQHVPTDRAAPERITVARRIGSGRRDVMGPERTMSMGYVDAVEYVRADLAAPSAPAEVEGLVERLRSWDHCWPVFSEAATALNALQAENERLREALTEIANAYTAHGYSDAMDAVQHLKSVAKEAIND